MPLFNVTKKVDAYACYSTIIEADTAEEARDFADSWYFDGKWRNEHSIDEFDATDIFLEDVEEISEEEAEDYRNEPERKPYLLSDQEHATVLAALRHYQAHLPSISGPIMQIATNDGEHAALNESAINALCERINS